MNAYKEQHFRRGICPLNRNAFPTGTVCEWTTCQYDHPLVAYSVDGKSRPKDWTPHINSIICDTCGCTQWLFRAPRTAAVPKLFFHCDTCDDRNDGTDFDQCVTCATVFYWIAKADAKAAAAAVSSPSSSMAAASATSATVDDDNDGPPPPPPSLPPPQPSTTTTTIRRGLLNSAASFFRRLTGDRSSSDNNIDNDAKSAATIPAAAASSNEPAAAFSDSQLTMTEFKSTGDSVTTDKLSAEQLLAEQNKITASLTALDDIQEWSPDVRVKMASIRALLSELTGSLMIPTTADVKRKKPQAGPHNKRRRRSS